jgi:sirohydrochlorin cobaltochelatase
LNDFSRKQGLLLVGHGTRDRAGRAEFLRLVGLTDRREGWTVEGAFLELAEPDIGQAVARLVERGVERLTVSPLLLFAAGHVKRDLPRAVRAALREHPGGQWRQAGHMGCHAALLELSARRFRAALVEREPRAADETLLLMVGRGSFDAGASAETRRFAALRAERTPAGRVETCFYAMAEPSLDAMLAEITNWPHRRVVVQPHLLFHGELLATIRERVRKAAQAAPRQEWIVTEHLGSDRLLAQALWERADAAWKSEESRAESGERRANPAGAMDNTR